ncbi:MAG: SDR family NAD(P)-dependent oxidoreductase [Clostridia bacterium]
MQNPYGNVALVTGASSGIGKCTAETLAKLGLHVYGASRRGGEPTQHGEGFVKMLTLDVTSDASVHAAVESVISAEGRIDILINCAGNGIAGALEDCSGADALSQMDVNYAGVVRVIGAALPAMRQRRNGLIINVGSVGGIYSVPFQTLYSSSKYALEALTEGLRIELKAWNIKAALVEPGDVKTGFTAARIYASGVKNTQYGSEFHNSIAQMEHDEQGGKGPETVVAVMLKLIKSKNPPVRRVVGAQYRFFVFLKRLLPARLVEYIMTGMYPKSGKCYKVE